MLADAGSPLLLTTEALADELPTQWTLPLLFDTDWDVIALNPDEALSETVVTAEQLAHVDVHVGFYRNTERRGGDAWRRGAGSHSTQPLRLDAEQTLLQLAPLTFDAST